jgi:hypothetical protein
MNDVCIWKQRVQLYGVDGSIHLYSDMLLVNNLHVRAHISKLDDGLLCNCSQALGSVIESKVF